MGRVALGGIAFAELAFAGDWSVAGWHRDILDFAISKTAAATGMQLPVIAGASAQQLEAKLEAIKDAAAAGNPYGSGKTGVYVCVPV